MNQTPLDLAAQDNDLGDRTGFDLGWDHARYGCVPPAELLLEGTPIGQGWRAARAVFGRRTLPVTRAVRQWLELRTSAWRTGVDFVAQGVTPNYLSQIDARVCVVTRAPLGGAAGCPTEAVLERLNPQAGYAPGNLVTLSRAAVQARAGIDVNEAVRRARAAEAGARADSDSDFDAGTWWRLAVLRSFATPLPFAAAAALPLALLPPNRVRVLNSAQALQALVTLQLAEPAWSERARFIAGLLPTDAHRTDFNLLVGALAPRVLEATHQGRDMGRALEDAWRAERVLRRWQPFALGLGEAGAESLTRRLAQAPVPGRVTLVQAFDQATEDWALPAAAARGMAASPRASRATRQATGPLRGAGPGPERRASARRSSPPRVRSAGAPGR